MDDKENSQLISGKLYLFFNVRNSKTTTIQNSSKGAIIAVEL